MGIDIINKKQVLLNDSHDRLVVTDVNKNPVEHHIELDKPILALFQRKKAKGRSGDGNPLIYALKEMYSFSISKEDKDKLYASIQHIIENQFSSDQFDMIIALPSSKPVVMWVAEACRAVLDVQIERNAFIKATNINILNQIQDIDDKDIIELRKTLEAAKPNGNFTMKDLSQHQRSFVEPVKVNPYYKPFGRILLVDDLVSSGSTLRTAYQGLKSKNPDIEIECLTFLGPVD